MSTFSLSNDLEDENGNTLIAVTWIVLLLSLVTIGLLKLTITHRQEVETAEVQLQNQLMAESAVEVFLHRYFFDPTRQIFDAGSFILKDERIDILVEDEGAKINLNRASFDLLSAMFIAEGETPENALRLAARTIDWRDGDSLEGVGGAEKDTYLDTGATILPRNDAFETIGELSNVSGITNSFFMCLRPILTVYSLNRHADIKSANSRVREIYAWAFENAWGETSWTDPAIFPDRSTGLAAIDSLVGRAMRIVVRLPNRKNQPQYETWIRFKSTADSDYNHLTGVRRLLDNSDICERNDGSDGLLLE